MLYSPAVNMPVAEPKVVVAHREDLWWLLAEACQLEHMIMCQYLFAEWTLKDKSDGLTDEQSARIEGWRGVLRGIAIEEMLHLALVANVMSSIGAAPYLGRPNFPQRSGYFPASIELDLMAFGEPALKHFLFLERPEGMERQDAEGFVPTAPRRDPLSESEAMPRGQEFLTVGHLYRGIEARLCAAGRGRNHRVGRGRARPLGRRPLRKVLLHLLSRFFSHTDETDEQLGLLIGAAFDLMGEIIRPLGHALTKLPVGSADDMRNAGFAFEMH
jgi:ferritin-like protein